ncbi:MAG: DUF188 domain-containing protein [Bacillota bacterium]|nr:DUF188 domain-containing protein [Bacillota bacterium]
MKIIVDADACPKTVLQICQKLGPKYDVSVWTVANFNHDIKSDHHVIVGNTSQEADLKILNITQKNDIIITQDWGLAAMVLGKQARCISPDGREYQSGNIDFLLEEREIKAKYRRSGGRTRGPKKRNEKDDRRFEASLEMILNNLNPNREQSSK